MAECDRCGGLRINGSPIRYAPSNTKMNIGIQPASHRSDADAVWCRACIQYACGVRDNDPVAPQNGETASG